jgi:hypothetical protein
MKYRIGLKLFARLFYKLLSTVSNIEIDVLRPDVQLLEDNEDWPRSQYRGSWAGLLRIATTRRRQQCSALGRVRTTRSLPVTVARNAQS